MRLGPRIEVRAAAPDRLAEPLKLLEEFFQRGNTHILPGGGQEEVVV